jgi:hypothetical protein
LIASHWCWHNTWNLRRAFAALGSVLALVTTGKAVWSAGEDCTLRAWCVSSGDALDSVVVDSKITSLVQMGKYIWACGQDTQIQIWNIKSMTLANTLKAKGHTRHINALIKVSSKLTRDIWSFSLADQKLCMWRAENTLENDFAEEASQLQAAHTVLDQAHRSLAEENAQLQNALHAERGAYRGKLEQVVGLLAGRSHLNKEQAISLEQQVASLSATVLATETQRDALTTGLQEERARRQQLERDLEESRTGALAAKKHLQGLLFEEEDKVARISAQHGDAKALLAQKQTETETLLVDKQRAVLTHHDQVQRFSEQQEELEELRARVAEQDATLAEQRVEQDVMQNQLDDAYIEHGRLQGRVEVMHAQLVAHGELTEDEAESLGRTLSPAARSRPRPRTPFLGPPRLPGHKRDQSEDRSEDSYVPALGQEAGEDPVSSDDEGDEGEGDDNEGQELVGEGGGIDEVVAAVGTSGNTPAILIPTESATPATPDGETPGGADLTSASSTLGSTRGDPENEAEETSGEGIGLGTSDRSSSQGNQKPNNKKKIKKKGKS